MATSEQILAAIYRVIDKGELDIKPYEDAFSCIRNMCDESGKKDVTMTAKLKGKLRKATLMAKEQGVDSFFAPSFDLNKRILCWESTESFDSYMLYMEIDRPRDKQFYLPRRKQLKPLADAMQELYEHKIELLAISLPPGVGKALANNTPILTRNGWKNHGDLVVGDEVIGMDGKFKKVIAVHPKCQLDCLVEFTNGESIVCHENHEWMVNDRGRRVDRVYTAETKRLEKRKLESGGESGHRGHRYVVQIPHKKYVVGENKDIFDPYTLGVWLGDGANRNPRICCAEKDKCVIDRIIKNGFPVRWFTRHKVTGVLYFDFDIRKQLQCFGMCHSRKTLPKHIPQEYLTASVEQRLNLLAGLIDTDGCLAGNKFQFTTSEESLRDSFVELISTFGWRASVIVVSPSISSSGITSRKKHYVIGFTPDCEIPCEIERKRNKSPRKQRMIAIRSIKRIEPQEGNCITVEGDGMYLAGRTMIPTHNTTLALFFLTWVAGKDPDKPILTSSHNNDFLTGSYNEILRMIDPQGEYRWKDVFPELSVIQTNAKAMMIDIGKDKHDCKRFMTLEFSSIGSGNAGKVRAQSLLYCDDLVESIEQAMSRTQMDKLWTKYSVDCRQRKIGDCVELHIATRWSVNDVIGRLEQKYGGNGKSKFITVPALNENDESNFDYPIEAGFTTEFYREQREAMDDASWRALYMNEPIEREGQLYSEDALRRYFELPDGEPDAIIGVCDTKDKGSDFCVLPVAYQYGQDFYIEDVLCEDYAPAIVDVNLAQILLKNKVQLCQFESNAAGGKTAEKVQNMVKEKGGITKIVTKYTTQNKETKIIVNQPWVLEHCLFKDNSVIKNEKEYRSFIYQLCSYTLKGRNAHDDVPDAMAQLALYAQNLVTGEAKVFKRPW